jgi:hypothetical protein
MGKNNHPIKEIKPNKQDVSFLVSTALTKPSAWYGKVASPLDPRRRASPFSRDARRQKGKQLKSASTVFRRVMTIETSFANSLRKARKSGYIKSDFLAQYSPEKGYGANRQGIEP